MKKISFVTLLTMMIVGLKAQSYTIEYEERANIENQLKNVTDPETRKRVSAYLSKPNTFYLYCTGAESIYIQERIKLDSLTKDELNGRDDKEKRIEIGKNNGGIYKNHTTGEYLREADVLGKKLLVVDKLEKINWELMDEKKKIGEYNCQKAKATINNEEITAWFTEDIPLQEGPVDFEGLPGLIIELTAEKKTYHAVKISNNKTQIAITKPSNGKVVTKKQYQKILEDKINELKRDMGNPPQRN